MKFVADTTWEKVFNGWREREANDPGWIRVATEKGWLDWESWRKNTASQIGAEGRSWQIFEFTNPLAEIPAMLVGPYTGWQSRLPEKNIMTFNDLVQIPEQYEWLKNHDKVKSMIANFPAPTEFIGLIREDNGKIVCLEGHHRAAAVALAKKDGQPINFKSPIRIALAKLPKEELALLDEILARGSSKNQQTLI